MNRLKLEQWLSTLAGHKVKVTVRGDQSFTISFDAADRAAGEKVAAFFKEYHTRVDVDDELGTFIYLEV